MEGECYHFCSTLAVEVYVCRGLMCPIKFHLKGVLHQQRVNILYFFCFHVFPGTINVDQGH